MNVVEYLGTLPQSLVEELYSDPWTCQAIFRSLPTLAKQYVIRMLFASPQLATRVDGWVKPEGSGKHKVAIERLLALQLCSKVTQGKAALLKLHPSFQERLKDSISRSGTLSMDEGNAQMQTGKGRTPEELDKYSESCFEAILRYMMGIPIRQPSENLIGLLINAGLMQFEGESALKITKEGYQFLLKDAHTQMWTLLLSYIQTTETRNMAKKDVLSFLFQLSFLIFGKGYPVAGLTPSQQILLQDLRELGLVYKRKSSADRFFPTRLAVTLSAMESPSDGQGSATTSQGFIVLESNYRLYAYTSSELQIAIMSLFAGMRYRLPNMVMGLITRENVRHALLNGITAEQIISYIRQNLHPETLKNNPPVPETVVDQIRLWEQERNRVTYSPGVLYDQFPSEETFLKVLKYARDIGAFIWCNVDKKMLMVTENGHEPMRKFIKQLIQM